MSDGAVRGSVLMQVGGLELLARYSLNSMRHTSVLSSLEEFREQERISVTDKEWNWRILRAQFRQKNLEKLYRKYDDKLSLRYHSVFLILLLLISISHILVLIFAVDVDVNSRESLTAIICYSLRAILSTPLLMTLFYEKIRIRFTWVNIVTSVLILIIFVLSDTIPTYMTSDPPLRPGYVALNLLACFVFLPIKNNYIAASLGVLISTVHLVVLWTHTYKYDMLIYYKLGADFLFLLGIIFIGVYYRLMSEVLKRRSFLDRRACIEITLRLSYEKEQEERLLLSILPEHIASVVKKDIRDIFMKITRQEEETISVPAKIFNHLYVEEHQNVSILYADIVNYTMITTTLPPRVLVETLNELFGKFDAASVEHDVLRIKFLGDCYYCVSGVPKENVWHAKSCVDLGLEMISIIAELRERNRLDIDMRIGVHTGNIMSGLIGIRKWQYDIWSKDVTIANRMESTGKAGKVHITKRTLEELSDFVGNYIIEPNFESRNDPILSKFKIETFLVTKPPRNSLEYQVTYRRASVGIERWMRRGLQQQAKSTDSISQNVSVVRRRTTGFMETNVESYRKMLKEADIQMKSVINNMASGICGEFFNEETLNPYTLLYRNASWERSFIKQPDPLFKYFIGAGLFILILMMGIQGLAIVTLEPITWTIYGALLILLMLLQPFAWMQYMWRKVCGSKEPKNFISKFLYEQSANLVWSTAIRSILYISVSAMLAIVAAINLVECDIIYTNDINNPVLFDENCIDPWHLSQMFTLALMISFLFCRVFFLFKWTVGFALTGIYLWIIWGSQTELFYYGQTWNYQLDPRIAQTIYIIIIFISLHTTDRQTEYRNRLDHRWKRQLTQEQEEAYTMKLVNNMLLQNILPQHVADIYLNTTRSTDDLYHEEYNNVAVMFASLTDYKLGVDDYEISERKMLGILDQLISDFDKLLLSENDKRLTVEKIKMAGWTYMAACGLEPGRRSSKGSETSSVMGPVMRPENLYVDDVVITMVLFATSMMKQLRAFNKSAFQNANLRIGISHGEVTAGVVGSSKPLYDIWGNAVNMASRMDSTGLVGNIQVTENTAIVLDRQGVLTQYRGETYVKGAGHVRTYFVAIDKNFDIIYKQDAQNGIHESTNL